MATLFERGLARIGPGVPIPYPSGPVESALYAVLFILLAPFTEEPVFRGFVLRAWLRQGTSMGLVLSGFLFALIHFQLAALLPLTLLGIALGFLVLRSNSLLAAIIAHACYNTLGALFTILPALRETPEPALILAGLIGLPVAVGLLWAFAGRFPASAQELPPRDRSSGVWTALSFVVVLGILGLVVVAELFLRLSPGLAGP